MTEPTSLTPEEFDACFDRFTTTVFRLETLQTYTVSNEDARMQAFREGLPRPERSVRTEPWLARIAVTTTQGKRWQRAHVVVHPLSEYLRYQLIGYVESQAAGEQIYIADREADPALARLNEDYWLFGDAYAVIMRYDDAGRWLGADYTEDPQRLAVCRTARETALAHAVPLNVYLASQKDIRHVA